jgi:xylose isomerase
MFEVLRAGGMGTGGFNFDAKLRRQSMDRVDLFHAHIGGIDTLARSLLAAADMIEEGTLDAMREGRYAGWDGELGRAILSGATSFEALAGRVTAGEIDPRPVSGRQELYENVVNRHIWVAEEHARIETGAGR